MPSFPDMVGYHGLTYRQLDSWAQKGYLPGGNPGTGNTRWLDAEQEAVAKAMARLCEAGLKPAVAAKVAPVLVRTGRPVRVGSIIVALGKDDQA